MLHTSINGCGVTVLALDVTEGCGLIRRLKALYQGLGNLRFVRVFKVETNEEVGIWLGEEEGEVEVMALFVIRRRYARRVNRGNLAC